MAVKRISPIMQQYRDHTDKLKAKGIRLIKLDCPGCKKFIETMPAPRNDVWDTVSQCPHCEIMYKKFTTGKHAIGALLNS